MGEVVKFKCPILTQKHQGKTLCDSGFHKWEVVRQNAFDVKRGKLVTQFCCVRCQATKNEAR